MKIELKAPYSSDWSWGYIQTNRENRQHVYLYCKETKRRSTTSYARYVMSTIMGRYLTEYEHVDHIDEDKTNDSFWNLQILSQEENKKKADKKLSRKMVRTICPCCSSLVEKEFRHSAYSGYLNKLNDFCSRSCSGKFRGKGKVGQHYEVFRM